MNRKNAIFKVIALLLSALVLFSGCSNAKNEKPLKDYSDRIYNGTCYAEGFELMEKIGAGWNLGNTLDAPFEGDWSPVATKDNIKSVKKMGFGGVRLPVTWSEHIGPAPEYKVDEEFMDRVEEVVDWIIGEDLYCILNMHHDEGWISELSEDHDKILDKYLKVWAQIADRFKDKPELLLFEATNEQGFKCEEDEPSQRSFDLMNELNLSFVETVRSSGGNNGERFLVLPCVWTNTYYTEYLELPEGDGRIIVAVHYYGPWSFSVNAWGDATWETEEEKQALKDDLLAAYNAFDGNVPIYIGEYGAWGAHLPYRAYYTEYLVKCARSLDMTMFMWDVGEVMDRGTCEWNDSIIPRLAISAGNGHTNSFVKPFEIYVKEGEISDIELEIEYNGNELLEINDGDKKLSSDDYTLTEKGVTLSKSYIEKIAQGEFGEKEILYFEFSDGEPYELHISYCGTPELERELEVDDLIGLTLEEEGLLPIDWNGQRAATIRGVKKSGGSANTREGWTEYFKMGDDFRLANGEVYITDEMRRMITDEVTLTFELFSGETFDVTITN